MLDKMFDKIGKEAKDLLGKGMNTDKKFSFETEAFDGLVRFASGFAVPRAPQLRACE